MPQAVSPPFLRLPLLVDLEGLRADLAGCLALEWPAHFNARDYVGGWSSLALRSPSGSATDITAHPGPAAPPRDTPLLARCPHTAALLARLPCRTESVRLLRQAPGGEIKPHRDPGLSYRDGVFRLHVPILSHPDVEFTVAGQRVPMQPGECWYADFSATHAVVNRGPTDRVHLVIDGLRDAATDAWFHAAGFPREAMAPAPLPDDVRRQVVAELLRQGTPTAEALAASLEAEAAAAARAAPIAALTAFLARLGIPFAETPLPGPTFLPGVEIRGGVVHFDRTRLVHPGDLLHEAGHVALCPPDRRAQIHGNVAASVPELAGTELGVILWSYAACLAADVPLDVVLHAGGYAGDAAWLRESFERGTYIGLPLLVWMGLCEDPAKARAEGREGFPHMMRWLRA